MLLIHVERLTLMFEVVDIGIPSNSIFHHWRTILTFLQIFFIHVFVVIVLNRFEIFVVLDCWKGGKGTFSLLQLVWSLLDHEVFCKDVWTLVFLYYWLIILNFRFISWCCALGIIEMGIVEHWYFLLTHLLFITFLEDVFIAAVEITWTVLDS